MYMELNAVLTIPASSTCIDKIMSFRWSQSFFQLPRSPSAVIPLRNRTKSFRPLKMKFLCWEECNIHISSHAWVQQNTQGTLTSSWSGCQVWLNLLIEYFLRVVSLKKKLDFDNNISRDYRLIMEHLNAFLPFEWDARLFHNIYPLSFAAAANAFNNYFCHHLPKNSRNFDQNVNG